MVSNRLQRIISQLLSTEKSLRTSSWEEATEILVLLRDAVERQMVSSQSQQTLTTLERSFALLRTHQTAINQFRTISWRLLTPRHLGMFSDSPLSRKGFCLDPHELDGWISQRLLHLNVQTLGNFSEASNKWIPFPALIGFIDSLTRYHRGVNCRDPKLRGFLNAYHASLGDVMTGAESDAFDNLTHWIATQRRTLSEMRSRSPLHDETVDKPLTLADAATRVRVGITHAGSDAGYLLGAVLRQGYRNLLVTDPDPDNLLMLHDTTDRLFEAGVAQRQGVHVSTAMDTQRIHSKDVLSDMDLLIFPGRVKPPMTSPLLSLNDLQSRYRITQPSSWDEFAVKIPKRLRTNGGHVLAVVSKLPNTSQVDPSNNATDETSMLLNKLLPNYSKLSNCFLEVVHHSEFSLRDFPNLWLKREIQYSRNLVSILGMNSTDPFSFVTGNEELGLFWNKELQNAANTIYQRGQLHVIALAVVPDALSDHRMSLKAKFLEESVRSIHATTNGRIDTSMTLPRFIASMTSTVLSESQRPAITEFTSTQRLAATEDEAKTKGFQIQRITNKVSKGQHIAAEQARARAKHNESIHCHTWSDDKSEYPSPMVEIRSKTCLSKTSPLANRLTSSSSSSSSNIIGNGLKAEQNGIKWQDTFEYHHYLPKDGNRFHYHWTSLVNTFSYLNDNFVQERRDALEAGRHAKTSVIFMNSQGELIQPGVPMTHLLTRFERTNAGDIVAARANVLRKQYTDQALKPVSNQHVEKLPVRSNKTQPALFGSIFASETRRLRKKKFQSLSLRSRESTEHFIDSKILPSAQVKLDFLNELNRLKFKPSET